jgi:hypothetical protein
MTLSFRSRLLSSPFLPGVISANLQPSVLQSEADFAAHAAFARTTWVPVLLSFPQKHALFKDIVTAVWRHLGDSIDLMVMNCRVPAGGRMPAALGEERIFLVADLQPEINRLTRVGCSFVAIREGFVRHPMEEGDNGLDLDWHLPPKDAAQRFSPLTSELLALGLSEAVCHATRGSSWECLAPGEGTLRYGR